MKRQVFLIAAGLLIGLTKAHAYDETQFRAVMTGNTDCRWCDLSGADFTGITISGVNLSGANLTGADLTGAAFTKVDLSGADLTAAIVRRTNFSDTDLKGAELDQVDLTDAVLLRTRLETAYCDWGTKLPESSGMTCMGVTIERK